MAESESQQNDGICGKKKFKVFHNNNYCLNGLINFLPNELLLLIFDYSQEYPNLMLVCKRWKEIIEKFHVFNSSKIFARKNCVEDFTLALNSNRKVELLIIVTQPDYPTQIDCLRQMLAKPDNLIAKCCILLKNEKNLFSMELLIKYLECLQPMEILYLNFHRLFFEVSDIPTITFQNLSFLSITDSSYQIVRKFLVSLNTPLLKIFKIKSDFHRHSECDNIFKFLNRNSEKIEEVEIQMNFCNFSLSKFKLELRPCRESHEELTKFLKNRVSKLKSVSIVMTNDDPNMYNFIYQQAKELESFYISFTFTIIVGLNLHCTMRNVKTLHVEYFQFSEENIITLARIFPNTESFHIRFSRSGKLIDDHKRLIRDSFLMLKEAKEFHWDFLVSTF